MLYVPNKTSSNPKCSKKKTNHKASDKANPVIIYWQICMDLFWLFCTPANWWKKSIMLADQAFYKIWFEGVSSIYQQTVESQRSCNERWIVGKI